MGTLSQGEGVTVQILSGLSARQRTVARKAIPILDVLGEGLGVYNLLRAAGIREPRVFVLGLIRAESDFQPGAVSPAGALGLMQVMPGTAAYFGIRHGLFELSSNIRAGLLALRHSLQELRHPEHALAGYNAGVHRVRKSLARTGDIPRITETRRYVSKIMAFYRRWVEGPLERAVEAILPGRL